MGVYIKDLKKPEDCDVCPIHLVFITCGCDRDHCMFQDVPEPHGRLIDADALMKTLSKVIDINASIEQRNEATDQERRCLWWFEQQIGIAPTILEAEEGE